MPVHHFKYDELEKQFRHELHPKVIHLLDDFADWSAASNYPEVVITHVTRTDQDQIDIYHPYALGLLRKAKPDPFEQAHVRSIRSYQKFYGEDDGPIMWALYRFTWHRIGCAVDFRNNHYRPEQLAVVEDWFKKRIRTAVLDLDEAWEFLSHDVGRGEHVHVGFKDFDIQAKFLQHWKPDLSKLRIPKK